MTEPVTRIMLPPLHPGQQQVFAEARRCNVASCERRWGKNVVVAVLVVQTLLEKRGRVAW